MADYNYAFTYVAVLGMCALLISAMGIDMNRNIGIYQEIVRFRYLTVSTLGLVISEAIWGILQFQRNRSMTALWSVSMTSLVCTSLASYLWYKFILEHLTQEGYITGRKWVNYVEAIPIILVLLQHMSSPWTHWTFYIDESAKYVRGILYPVQALLSMAYLIVAVLLVLRCILQAEKMSKETRRRLSQMLIFTCFPVAGGILQVIFGIAPFTSMAVALAITYLFVSIQESNVSTDALTGLTNRAKMNKILNNKLELVEHTPIVLFIADLDEFKKINDGYGHVEGDKVLMLVADVFRTIGQRHPSFFICRYGGDEFLYTINLEEENVPETLQKEIEQELLKAQENLKNPYKVSMTMGYRIVKDKTESIEEIIESADKMLYERKKKYYNE